ncbi:MAG: hypothetical protein WC389_15145 [Lutibacter sp.]|jgi:hypothetical protein
MTLLANLLSNFSLASFAIEVGMLIIAVIVMNMANRKAIEDKYEKKADKEKVDCIEKEVKIIHDKKADTDYVKEQVRSIHHRITEHETNTLVTLNRMESNQSEMLKHIMEILKEMPRK